jgi:hypothetical protein
VALASTVAASAVRALGATLRCRLSGAIDVAPAWSAGRPLIYAVWHGRILMIPWATAWLARTRGARRPRVLVSRSVDGEMVARWVRHFGMRAVRGSSSRGGADALRQLLAVLRGGRDVAIVPDGPRGPRMRVQPGIVALAALSGAPIVPVAFGARPARSLATWDEFLIPLPFARAALVFGRPIQVDRDADRESARRAVEQGLAEATAEADRLVPA